MPRELLLALLLAWLLAACQRASPPEAAEYPRRVRCVPATGAQLADDVTLRGTVTPLADRDALVSPQTAGRLTQVQVHEGDVVRLGELLASVDDGPLIDAAHQAEAALGRAKAEHDNAKTTLERVRRVFERGIAARQEVDDSATKVAAARASEAEAEAAAHVARRQVSRALVQSPLAGTVIKLFRKPGELVDGTPATPVAEVADLSRLELLADVPARELVRLSAGQPARVTFPFLAGEFSGHVSRVSPAVDRMTGIGTTRVEFERPDAGSPPLGALGLAHVETGEPRAVTLVPTAALRRGATEIVTCVEGRARVLAVRVGEAVGDAGTVVDAALPVGTLVAVDPVVGLEDGDALEVSP